MRECLEPVPCNTHPHTHTHARTHTHIRMHAHTLPSWSMTVLYLSGCPGPPFQPKIGLDIGMAPGLPKLSSLVFSLPLTKLTWYIPLKLLLHDHNTLPGNLSVFWQKPYADTIPHSKKKIKKSWEMGRLLTNVWFLFLESSFHLKHLMNSYSYFNLTYGILCKIFMPVAPHPHPIKEPDPLSCGSITTSMGLCYIVLLLSHFSTPDSAKCPPTLPLPSSFFLWFIWGNLGHRLHPTSTCLFVCSCLWGTE